MPLTSIQKRIITSLLLILTLILALYLGGTFLIALVAAFSGAALWEFYSMFWDGKKLLTTRIIAVVCGMALVFASAMAGMGWTVILLLASFWICNFHFLFSYSSAPETSSYRNSLILFAGLVYIPLTLQFFTTMTSWEILFVLMASSASDTAAFYAGSYFGKKKIWPAISPKKSWAGSFGGLVACIIACSVYGKFLGNSSLISWIIFGAALNIAAQMGDFFESALKRKLGIKDSGVILPGHGGVLDRIDSLVLVLPIYIIGRQIHTFF
jgi:phosphatidate cytidylyltransferase